MGKKKIIYITLLALFFGLVSGYLIFNNTNSTTDKELSDFSIKDTSSVTKIFLSDMNKNSVKVVKIKPGEWIVNDKYPVRNDNINTIFKTLIWIEVKEPVPTQHLEQVNARLAAIATKVEIYQNVYRINLFNKIKLFPHEKLTKTFYVGDATSDQMGTYMLMDKSKKPFITYMPGFRGYLTTRFSCRENDWRTPRIFNSKLGEIKSIAVDFVENPENSFKIINNKDRTFTLFATDKGLHKINGFDTLNVLNYMSSFENINFEAVINQLSKKDSIVKSTPFHILTLETFSGEIQKIKTFHKWAITSEEFEDNSSSKYDKDRLYALINDGKDFVLIQFYVFDKLLRPLSYFKGIKN